VTRENTRDDATGNAVENAAHLGLAAEPGTLKVGLPEAAALAGASFSFAASTPLLLRVTGHRAWLSNLS
jgi:hypothetical protein